MKKFFLLAAIALFTFSINSTAQTANNNTTEQQKSPFDGIVEFSQDTIDYGTTKLNKPVTVTFKFTNVGEKPLIIKDAQASCGCTTPDWTKAPVLPGKSGTIKATYNASGMGKIMKTVFVNFQGIPRAKQLILTGEVLK
ncbi:MAG TPA: DUF1573 domain-containing protein [Chitinophagaceae bacterium]|nr:DUF1573 domain-containing protein [Chitinophagaceae bacterium]